MIGIGAHDLVNFHGRRGTNAHDNISIDWQERHVDDHPTGLPESAIHSRLQSVSALLGGLKPCTLT